MSRFVELLVVVDTEGAPALPHRSPQTASLGREETRSDAGENYQGRKPVDFGYAHSHRISRYLGIVPRDWKEDRSRSQDAEVVAGVRVLPNIIPTHDGIAAERLLQTGMEFIALAGLKRWVYARYEGGENRGLSPGA